MERVVVIIPSRDRPLGLHRALNSIWQTRGEHQVTAFAVLDEPDAAGLEVAMGLTWVTPIVVGAEYLGRPQDKFNIGYAAARETLRSEGIPDAEAWVVTFADDCEFDGPGWIDAALAENRRGYVGMFDGNKPTWAYATLHMATVAYIENIMEGLVGLPWYHVWCADMEWAERAKRAGAYACSEKVRFTHHHPLVSNKVASDPIYELASQWYADDLVTYDKRFKAGFPAGGVVP